MKAIRCNLTRNMSDFRNFHRIIIKVYGDTSLKITRNFTDLSKNYTLVYFTAMFEALSLLVYKSDPHSKGYNSISILYLSLWLVPV